MPLEPGDYSLVIRAVDEDDRLIQTESLIKGRVEAVDMSGIAAQLETNSGIFSMNKIEKVGAAL
jgi:flagellar basal-body rod modification protein FlgD